MEFGCAFLISVFSAMFSYIVYGLMPSENTKVESFGGFINRSLIRFEYEKSPLHTIF